jgi:hypothetical protein
LARRGRRAADRRRGGRLPGERAGGVTGFGFALVCTLLLLTGFPLADVVVVDLTISGVARIVVAARLRAWVNRRRALWLVLGFVPGLLLLTGLATVATMLAGG